MQKTVTDEPTRLDTEDLDPTVPGFAIIVVNEGEAPIRVAPRSNVTFSGANRGILVAPGLSLALDVPARGGIYAIASADDVDCTVEQVGS